jgi:hypothetical protein
MTGCYLADHGIHERGDMPSCDGFFVRCHLLPKQLLSRKGIPYSQIWSEDVWVWACGGPQGNAELWVSRFGERCGICGRPPGPNRRLDRDHDHKTGDARGLLCHRCNRGLPNWVTVDWLKRAIDYLEGRPAYGPPPTDA